VLAPLASFVDSI